MVTDKFCKDCMGCCFGGLAKLQSRTEKKTELLLKRKKITRSTKNKKVQWSSSLKSMDNVASNSYSVETQHSAGPAAVTEDEKASDRMGDTQPFVNHALIAWHQQRMEWLGDQTKKTRRVPRESIISWCTTYDDLLSTNRAFPQPIPLTEMVDFLVDIWHEEGLYD